MPVPYWLRLKSKRRGVPSAHPDTAPRCNLARYLVPVAMSIALPLLSPQQTQAHGPEMLLGSTAANGGALGLSYDFSTLNSVTPTVSIGGLTLSTSVFPGFEWLQEDAPDLDLFALKSGTPFSMQVVSIDAGLSIKFGSVTLKAAGDSTVVGTTTRIPGDHVHPEWQLLLPDAVTGTYRVSFRVTTSARGFSQSPVYTLAFSNAPEPTATVTAGATATPSATLTTAPSPSPTETATSVATDTATPTPTPIPLLADANCDGIATAADFTAMVKLAWGQAGAVCGADIDGDGKITDSDLTLLLDVLFLAL